MLNLTELQGADIRQVKTDLEEAGFKNITIKLHPSFERVGSKQDPLFQQIWPRLRVAITFDVPKEGANSNV